MKVSIQSTWHLEVVQLMLPVPQLYYYLLGVKGGEAT